ncbi:MAG: divalent-cation tolerance protein CutA [Verrucomicrobiales bacterium]|jgi:periplasmic divalent cation tolerance protein
MEDIRLVLSTFPSIGEARQIGTVLVGKQLAACVNFLPGVESIYHWQGRVETASEVLAIFKTTAARQPDLCAALAALHPYEVPEILALEPSAVFPAYAKWISEAL